jgi:hypothetical protein
MDTTKETSYLDQVKEVLASQLGLEATDISEEDSFTDDLHMRPTEVSDFLQELATHGFETEDIDLASIGTVGELVESLSSHIYTQ